MNKKIKSESAVCQGYRFSVEVDGREVGRAYLYVLSNSLHQEPFGFLEDVFVEEDQRGAGIGTELIGKVMDIARHEKCYKIVACSRSGRTKVHELYKRLGFEQYGFEFRKDLN